MIFTADSGEELGPGGRGRLVQLLLVGHLVFRFINRPQGIMIKISYKSVVCHTT